MRTYQGNEKKAGHNHHLHPSGISLIQADPKCRTCRLQIANMSHRLVGRTANNAGSWKWSGQSRQKIGASQENEEELRIEDQVQCWRALNGPMRWRNARHVSLFRFRLGVEDMPKRGFNPTERQHAVSAVTIYGGQYLPSVEGRYWWNMG